MANNVPVVVIDLHTAYDANLLMIRKLIYKALLGSRKHYSITVKQPYPFTGTLLNSIINRLCIPSIQDVVVLYKEGIVRAMLLYRRYTSF
jgi:hypothetical protein